MKKLRVLWVSPHCWPDYYLRPGGLGIKSQGGQTVVMYYATEALTRLYRSLSIDIYARYERGEPFEIDLHERTRMIRLLCGTPETYVPKEQFWGAPLEQFVNEVDYHAERNELRYDLIHAHYADGWHTACELSKRWNVPYICTTHSLGKRKRANALRTGEATAAELDRKYNFKPRIASEIKALKNATMICPLTVEEGQYMVEHYGIDPAKVRVVNNGIVLSQFHPPKPRAAARIRRELGIGPGEYLVSLFGRVDPRKGQAQLIEAAPLIRDRVMRATGKKVRFLFLGWSESEFSRSLVGRMKKLKVDDGFILHPPVNNRETPAYYWATDVYALSSTYDILPIALLEAMGCGLAVVSTNNGGPSEVITSGKDGILLDPRDADNLAGAISGLLIDEKLRGRMGAEALRTIRERYTWDRLAARMWRLYREILTGKGASA